MFNNNVNRIGFCCKYLDEDQTQKPKILKEIQQQYTDRSTTVAWCNRQEKSVAEDKLLDIVEHNMQSAYNLVDYVGNLVPERRMLRLSSSQIPMATEPSYRYVFEDKTVRDRLEVGFRRIGDHARERDVKLSFHPGQFCVLASDNPDVVERSIDEFEYHADMARWMGYGQEFQDFKCNVHISGRKGYQGIIDILPRLSPEARNIITIENDEMCHGLDASLELEKHVALVLDIHHHWIRDQEYIQPDDDRVKRVVDSWRGVRPTLHYSYSRDEWLDQSSIVTDTSRHTSFHSIQELLDTGAKKQKLRAHSDYFPNEKVNDWALSFWDQFDIQCEAKAKNLASQQLYDRALVHYK
jgi:UV DNA damage repair endonuclease|tara:strand:+ start:1633 stop:2691 length:1059 start_codon:yes stop_codon:yes gene_type:complete